MYNKLFNLLYSDRITEDVKLLILEKIDLNLSESNEEVSPYVEYINTLIKTDISSEALEEVLDMTFSGLSEEEIDAITEEFIKASVEAYISEASAPIGLVGVRKEAARREATAMNKPKAERPIGLAGIRKAATQAEAPKPAPKNNEFKGPSAMDRLKSAATKVKNFASKATSKVKEVAGKAKDWAAKNLKPKTHAEKLQQQKDDRVKKAVEMGTGSKDEPEAKQLKMDFNKPADNTPAPEKKDENKRTVTLSRGKNRRLALQKLKDKVGGKQAEEVSAPPENKNTEVTSPTAVDSEKPASNKKRGGSTRKTTVAKLRDSAKNAATGENKKTNGGKKSTSGGKKKTNSGKKKTNEALADIICLLADTNISEATLEFIINAINEGKIFNEQNRVKVVEKKKSAYENALNKLDQAVEKEARTHTNQVTPSMVNKVEHAGLSYETAKANTEHKYGHKID